MGDIHSPAPRLNKYGLGMRLGGLAKHSCTNNLDQQYREIVVWRLISLRSVTFTITDVCAGPLPLTWYVILHYIKQGNQKI